MTKTVHWWSWSCDLHGSSEGRFCSRKYSRRPQRDPKVNFFPYKQESVRNGDHEWLRMTNAFILCNLVWKVQKSHAANREGSFNPRYKLRHGWALVYRGSLTLTLISPLLVIKYPPISDSEACVCLLKWMRRAAIDWV